MRRHAVGAFLSVGFLCVLASVATAQPKASASDSGKDGGASAPVAATSAKAASSSTPTAASSSDAGAGPAVPIPDKPAMDGATYAVRLRDLEQRVDELKDQIRRSHTRLALLSDTIISGGAAGSRAEVTFHNEMSSAFKLVRALFVVDGAVQYNKQDDSGALAEQKEIPIFNGSMPPGDHTVQVILNFQGNGYGVFTYLRGYKFEVKSAHSFTAVEGKTLGLVATALEKGGVTTPLEQRPTIEWGEHVASLGPGGAGAGAAPTNSAAPAPASSGGVSGSVNIGGGK